MLRVCVGRVRGVQCMLAGRLNGRHHSSGPQQPPAHGCYLFSGPFTPVLHKGMSHLSSLPEGVAALYHRQQLTGPPPMNTSPPVNAAATSMTAATMMPSPAQLAPSPNPFSMEFSQQPQTQQPQGQGSASIKYYSSSN